MVVVDPGKIVVGSGIDVAVGSTVSGGVVLGGIVVVPSWAAPVPVNETTSISPTTPRTASPPTIEYMRLIFCSQVVVSNGPLPGRYGSSLRGEHTLKVVVGEETPGHSHRWSEVSVHPTKALDEIRTPGPFSRGLGGPLARVRTRDDAGDRQQRLPRSSHDPIRSSSIRCPFYKILVIDL